MGRLATKASANVWYKARLAASRWDERMKSRAGAAEVLGISESAVSDTELEYEKAMTPDKAELMAVGYKAPYLINHYCSENCPLGAWHDISAKQVELDEAVIKLLKDIKEARELTDKLLAVAYDNKLDKSEISELEGALGTLGRLSSTISEFKALYVAEKMRCGNEHTDLVGVA